VCRLPGGVAAMVASIPRLWTLASEIHDPDVTGMMDG
jgi:hypothetical protein